MVELKPCPFCGGFATVLRGWDMQSGLYHVVCPQLESYKTGCGGSSGFYDTREKAVEAWNRRAEND